MAKITVITSLYNCSKYLEDYFRHVQNISNLDEVEILLLHNAPSEEETTIINRYLPIIPALKHIIIPQREGLYQTWNRGVKMAAGEYCAIWNVDDIRFPDSLRLQADILDSCEEVVMPYGNFYITRTPGSIVGKLRNEKDCAKRPIQSKVNHLIGCFPMWRKSIHDQIGYFDEQFKLASDYEFQIRVAHTYKLHKIDAVLGCYLSGNDGKLSNNIALQQSEVTAIEWRYGILYKMNLTYLRRGFKYKWDSVLSYGQYLSLSDYFKRAVIKRWCLSPLLILPILCYPYQLARVIKHILFK